jgi:L-fuculose-phosphate aldolase
MPAQRYQRLRQAIVAAGRRLDAAGLIPGASGNISVRAGDGFLVTPTGVPCERVTAGQIVRMDLDGRHAGNIRPSSEWRLHRDIYRTRPEAGAVVHTHSPTATALSCLRQGIPAFHYMVAAAGGGDIRCADYATFGTEALSAAALRALDGRRACLLANHGTVAFAGTLDGAVRLSEEVEALARQYAQARALGEPALLTKEEMAEVRRQFATYGQQPAAARPSRRR